MSRSGPTKVEYDSLIYKLATLESELGQARKLLEAPPKKPGWWKRLFSPYIVVLVMSFLLLPTVSCAAENHKQKALRGLKGVHVLVEDINPEAERLGLSRDQIKTDAELRLRKAGVRVLTKKEWEEMPGNPLLYVNVNTSFRQDPSLVAYSISVELQERVTLARGFKTPGTIWNKGEVGTVGTEEIREIWGFVGDQVDEFINDFMGANPKK